VSTRRSLQPPVRCAAALRLVGALALAALCAGCAGGARYGAGWDGRRGYDGNGDYGYDLAASRSEASSYRARAARNYPVPGTPDDPWGPYVREAAAHYQIPERWIREVMRQESGGHEYGRDGYPITSGAGAMGLMQVMPRTYDTLRQQYGLGPDPYDPHDNILAGAAYIRDMYAIYGSPGFLAAYNAGPDRLATYLAGSGTLPDETVNYLASVAPRLGNDVPMTGPLAVYGGQNVASAQTYRGQPYQPPSYQAQPSQPQPYQASSDAAYAGGGMVVSSAEAAEPTDPADRAYDGGGLVTPDAPTGRFSGTAPADQGVTLADAPGAYADRGVASQSLLAPATLVTPVAAAQPAVVRPAAAPVSYRPVAAPAALTQIAAPGSAPSGWAIQVGAFPDPAHSQAMIAAARARAADLLASAQPAVIPVQRGGTLYRARLVGLSASNAAAACGRLSGAGIACFTVPPGS
jgi:D-alanyl-D-alanine carboxypeptidase